MKKVLILGSKGFIGKNFINYIQRKNDKYKIFSDTKKKDLSIKSTWKEFIKVDTLVFLAGVSTIEESNQDPRKCFQVNINSIINALEFCKKNKTDLIFISSSSCKNFNNIQNPYTISKLFSEKLCKFYSKKFGISVTILRLFNVYGKDQPSLYIIPKIIFQLKNKNEITVENLNSTRDYIYIDDVCEAIYLAINKKIKFKILDVGTGKSHSVKQLIDLIQKLKKTKLKVKNLNKYNKKILHSKAHINQTVNVLNWRPKTDIKSGLIKLF